MLVKFVFAILLPVLIAVTKSTRQLIAETICCICTNTTAAAQQHSVQQLYSCILSFRVHVKLLYHIVSYKLIELDGLQHKKCLSIDCELNTQIIIIIIKKDKLIQP